MQSSYWWYSIGHRLELKYFLLAQFLLNTSLAAHWPPRSEKWDLEIRTDIQDRLKGGWSGTLHNSAYDYFQQQIAKTVLKLNIEECPANAWLSYTAFCLQPIWLQTLGAIYSELCQTLFPNFCPSPFEVAILFSCNLSCRLSRCQFSKACWLRSAVLHSFQFMPTLRVFQPEPKTRRMFVEKMERCSWVGAGEGTWRNSVQ